MFWLTEAACADDFPYTLTGEASSGRVPAQRVSFSSYPAVLNSGDDFCKNERWMLSRSPRTCLAPLANPQSIGTSDVTSAGLVVQETTIGNSNPDLATAFVSPLTLMEWLRNMLANR